MSSPPLPNFDHALQLAQGNLQARDLAECHGVLCGLLCRQPNSATDDYFGVLSLLELVPRSGAALDAVLEDLFDATGRQLLDEDMGMVLWLPDDDEPLEVRTSALAHWCSGFLAGLAGAGGGNLETLSGEAGEALQDLREIARAAVEDGEGSEEEEEAFAEIVEYIRVATLTLFEDLRGPRARDRIH